MQKIHTVNSQGRPLVVECPVCRKMWDWPTVREDKERRREQMRVKSKRYYEQHREEILAREREYREYKTRAARERRHRNRAHLHPLRTCPVCGMRFIAKSRSHKFCSARCRESSPTAKRTNARLKDRAKRRADAYLKALEAVAEGVGKLEECRKIRDSTE